MSTSPQPGKQLVEVHSLTPQQKETVEVLPSIWGEQWASLDKVPDAALKQIAREIILAFPDFGALEIMRYFYILGGKLEPSAEFWMHQAAQHPDYRGLEFEPIEPGSDLWKEFLGRQDPAAIRVALLAESKRLQRGTDVLRVERECGLI